MQNRSLAPVTEVAQPAEALDRTSLGFVLATHPVGVAVSFQSVQHVRIVDLAFGVGFVPVGNLGQLNVSDVMGVTPDGIRQVTTDVLRVENVEHQLQVRAVDFVQCGNGCKEWKRYWWKSWNSRYH